MEDKVIIAISNITMLTTASYGWLTYKDNNIILKPEIEEFFRIIADNGANATRLLPYSGFANKMEKHKMFQPYIYNKTKGLWNLDRFNSEYFSILKQIIKLANKYNLKVWFSLFDNCQFFKDAKEYSPWVNNLQGLNSYMESDKYSKKWINRVLKEFKGLNVGYELGNELEPKIGMKASVNWAVEIIKYLLDLNVDPKNITYGAIMKECENYLDGKCPIDFQSHIKGAIDKELGEYVKLSIFRPVHGIYKDHNKEYPLGLNIEQSLDWWGNHPIRIWFSDDGCFNGDENHCDIDLTALIPERRPSANTWRKLMKYIFKYKTDWGKYSPLFAIEHLPANIKNFDCIKNTTKAISEEYKNKFGKYPFNWRKFPKPNPEPVECSNGETQVKKCKDGSEIIIKRCIEGYWFETNEICPTNCSCWYYLETLNFKRFFQCLFKKYPKKCKEEKK